MNTDELPTFERLKELEPELGRLEAEIQTLPVRRGFDVLAAWYGQGERNGYKQRVHELVGWSRAATIPDPKQAPVPHGDGSEVRYFDCAMLLNWPHVPNPRFHPELETERAYDVAYQHLYGLLCRVTQGGAR